MDKNILEDVVTKLKKFGMNHTDISIVENFTTSIRTRIKKPEEITQADTVGINIRTFYGKKNAVVTTDNISNLQDKNFLEKIATIAKNSPEYDENPLPSFENFPKSLKKIDIMDSVEVSVDTLLQDATECENLILQSDGITNSEGAEISYDHSKVTLMKDHDFFGEYEKTIFGFSVAPLAEKNGELQQGYATSSAIYYEDLKTPTQLAKKAVKDTVSRLGSRKVKTCKVPVIFDHEISNALLMNLLRAMDGAEVSKGTTFLADKLSKKIFSDEVCINDRVALDRGLRSRPFDADGIFVEKTSLIKNGAINSFLLNTKYANKLKMKSTGNASGFSAITPNNVCMENGKESVENLIKNIKGGLLVTGLLGDGFSAVTGNYSQGATGFWIENGEVAYPVHEITLAGNFSDMFANVVVANDLEIRTGVDAPSLYFDQMTVGGI